MRRSYDPSKRITKKGSKKGILLGGGPIYNDWKMKVSTAEFLKKYREYESLLLEHGSNYKQAEDSASGITQKRMRSAGSSATILSIRKTPDLFRFQRNKFIFCKI